MATGARDDVSINTNLCFQGFFHPLTCVSFCLEKYSSLDRCIFKDSHMKVFFPEYKVLSQLITLSLMSASGVNL